jgi:hypothetical protein
MDTLDRKYFDDAFKLINTRITSIEAQVTMLLNAEKKRYADAQGISFESADKHFTETFAEVYKDLKKMASALQVHIQSEG